ncbi:MAG: T9SS type A sorting domain-containing protein [Saprospiraceae bacterium]|nr:T9SS type A sorting domain-containing protein [Saprospiraceae bacterium]
MPKQLLFLLAFVIGLLFHSEPLAGQGCNLKTGIIAFACTSGADLSYTEGTDCYTEMRVLLSAGTFYEWTANTADNWIVEQLAPNELLVTHSNGLFPSGDHTMLNFLYYTPGGSPTELILLYPDGCVMESCENIHALPGCGEGCISGTVYRECADEPFSDQPTLEGFLVEVTDDMGNIVSEYTTSDDGNYSICDLPPGNYIVKATKSPGWTANVPASGMYAMELTPGTEEFRNFGSCPECDCDDVEILLQEDVSIQDSSVYNLCLFLDNLYCFEKILLEVDSGEITSWENLPAGWDANLLSPTMLEIVFSFVHYEPCKFRVAMTPWGDPHENLDRKWTISALGFNDIPNPLICVDSLVFEHPSRYKPFTCCPDGSIMGPELVINGNFQIITPPLTDYNYVTTPSTSGEVSIMNQLDAYNANNAWVCGAKGGPLDNYFVVDGSLTPGLAVWKQQVSGFTAGDQYVFCALFNNLVKPALDFSDPIVELILEDDFNPLNTWTSGPLTISEIQDNWEDLSLSWTVPVPSASYTLKIISHDINFIGNDFAVDCISFRQCTPAPPDPCCKDIVSFCADIDSALIYTIDADSCKVTMDLSTLAPCYYLEWIDWGQGPEYGPWSSLTPPPMHSFSGNGTYYISFLAIALNDSNFICLEKVITDTLTLSCEPCICNVPNMSITTSLASYQLFCTQGAPTPSLPCPLSDVVISGFFGCETASGGLCEETAVHYVLTGPNGIVDQGFTTPFPSLTYTVSQIGAPGTYSLTLSTLCPGQTDSCVCTVRWVQEACDTCYCGGFEDMFVRTPQGAMNMAVSCGGPPLTIPCPDPGKGFHLTGVFGCAGGGCPPDHQIDWTLVHQSTGTTHTGGFQDNDPYFGIHILPTYISQPGLYTLTMTGVCNGDTCLCEVQFLIDCPDLCPCDIDDILALSSNVDKGFAVALANKSCNACFSPLAVSDCETVDWYVNSTAGAPIGSSIGSQTFCYKFPFSGTYTVYMVVTRLKPDGSQCEVFVKSQIVTVLCTIFDDCLDSRLTNASFNENPIAGGLGQGGSGEAPGWVAATDNPVLLEGPADSHDGWTMLLTGCYFNSDVLSTSVPVCLSKTDSGILSLRLRTPGDPIPGVDVKLGRKPPGGNRIIIQLFNDKAAPPPDPCLEQKGGCNIIGVLEDLIPLDSTDWWDVFIPYDMNKMVWTDSCGDQSDGIPVYLSIKMANMLSADQGDGNVRDAVLIDNICLEGTLVQTEQFPSAKGITIKPNPTTGYISIELSEEANANTTFRVMGLTGQTFLNTPAQVGSKTQTLQTAPLPSGLYFLQVIIDGQVQHVVKMVKQE